MALDPLAQYRKSPGPTPGMSAPSSQGREEYEAFGAKDHVSRLRIRSRKYPVNAPGYNILLNVVYDAEGTSFLLIFTVISVVVQGRNLQSVIFAIENAMADYIQEFDPQKWAKPTDPNAPFIESMLVKAKEEDGDSKSVKH